MHDVHEIFVLRFESAIERVWESWSELIQRMLLLFSMALSVEAKRTGQRVPKGFSAPEISLIWIKLGIRRLKTKLEWDSGLKVCLDGMPKIILGKPDCTKFWVGITGLKNIMGDPLDMPLNSSWIVYNDNSTFDVDSVLSRTHTTITYCFFNIRFSDSLIRTKSSWFPSLWNSVSWNNMTANTTSNWIKFRSSCVFYWKMLTRLPSFSLGPSHWLTILLVHHPEGGGVL